MTPQLVHDQAVLPFAEAELVNAVATKAFLVRSRRAPSESRRPKPDLKGLNLDLPLFDVSAWLVDEQCEVRPGARTPEARRVAESMMPDTLPDTLECLCKVHAGILYRQLELLLWARDASGALRKEILGWVFNGPAYDLGSGRMVPAIYVPFSFDLCCLIEQVDADALRSAIRDRLEAIRNSPERRVRAALH